MIFNRLYSRQGPPQEMDIRSESLQDFHRNREIMMVREMEMSLGFNLTLSPLEKIANEVITDAKLKEIEEGFLNPSKFTPAYRFPGTLNAIRKTSLYHLVKTMPKGGILHAHDIALGSASIVVDLTYKRFCWICIHGNGALEFTFSRNEPNRARPCERWQLMKDYRRNGGMSDEELSEYFMVNTTRHYKDINGVWSNFQSIFDVVSGVITYKDNFGEYIERTLKELLDDGVQYVELRTSLSKVSFII